MKIYLASKSPRRAELLSQIGIQYEIIPISVDESYQARELPCDYLKRVTQQKLFAAKKSPLIMDNYPILVADTIIVKSGKILGKPNDALQAKEMLLALSNSWHLVGTECLIEYNQKIINKTSETWVKFRKLNLNEIDKYCASDEPIDKAGSYAIQGNGAVFIEKIEGSYSGVMGLDLYNVNAMLTEIGFDRI